MGRKRPKSEEIVAKLRQVDVLVRQGQPVAEAVRRHLTADITALARQYGRYGYRKIAALLRSWGAFREQIQGV